MPGGAGMVPVLPLFAFKIKKIKPPKRKIWAGLPVLFDFGFDFDFDFATVRCASGYSPSMNTQTDTT